MYYNAGWQLVEAEIYEGWSSGSPGSVDQRRAWFWGARYIDDAIEMLVDDDNDGDYWFGPLEAVGDFYYFFLHDAQFSTVAVLDDAANLKERVTYDAYGRARHHDWRDNDGDGDYDSTDRPLIGLPGGYPITHASYSVDFDLDRDGDMDLTDLSLAGTSYPTPLTRGELSLATIGNIVGYDGYLFDREMEQYTVRYRHYDPMLGRWMERDPAGYVDSCNLFLFALTRPLTITDSHGLDGVDSGLIMATGAELIQGLSPLADSLAHFLKGQDHANELLEQLNGTVDDVRDLRTVATSTGGERQAAIVRILERHGKDGTEKFLEMAFKMSGVSNLASRWYAAIFIEAWQGGYAIGDWIADSVIEAAEECWCRECENPFDIYTNNQRILNDTYYIIQNPTNVPTRDELNCYKDEDGQIWLQVESDVGTFGSILQLLGIWEDTYEWRKCSQ